MRRTFVRRSEYEMKRNAAPPRRDYEAVKTDSDDKPEAERLDKNCRMVVDPRDVCCQKYSVCTKGESR